MKSISKFLIKKIFINKLNTLKINIIFITQKINKF